MCLPDYGQYLVDIEKSSRYIPKYPLYYHKCHIFTFIMLVENIFLKTSTPLSINFVLKISFRRSLLKSDLGQDRKRRHIDFF